MRSPRSKADPKPRTIVDGLCRQLADEIVEGALLPGVRLDETGLAERFGVSRTPVREALRQLEAIGVVTRRPTRGVVVATVSAERLADMFEAMAELEALCANLSAERMTARERQALERLHARAGEYVVADAEARYEEANRQFHQALYDGAHNAEIAAITHGMRGRLAPFRRAQFRVAGRLECSHAEHDVVVRAILENRGADAGAAMRAHILAVADTTHSYRSGTAPRR